MPRKPLQRITAWSFSRYSTYIICPLQAFFKYTKKIQGPTNDAMSRGKKIHKDAELYCLGEKKRLPKSLALFDVEFKELRKLAKKRVLQVEEQCQFAFTKSWEPCEWFSRDAWLRVMFDAMYVDGDTLVIIDHKTGKIRPQHKDQLELYAVAGFIIGPEHITKVRADLWYLDQGEIVPDPDNPREYTRADAEKLRKEWVKRTKKMLADTTFKPSPGALCRWCYFGKSGVAKGGPGLCKF